MLGLGPRPPRCWCCASSLESWRSYRARRLRARLAAAQVRRAGSVAAAPQSSQHPWLPPAVHLVRPSVLLLASLASTLPLFRRCVDAARVPDRRLPVRGRLRDPEAHQPWRLWARLPGEAARLGSAVRHQGKKVRRRRAHGEQRGRQQAAAASFRERMRGLMHAWELPTHALRHSPTHSPRPPPPPGVGAAQGRPPPPHTHTHTRARAHTHSLSLTRTHPPTHLHR